MRREAVLTMELCGELIHRTFSGYRYSFYSGECSLGTFSSAARSIDCSERQYRCQGEQDSSLHLARLKPHTNPLSLT